VKKFAEREKYTIDYTGNMWYNIKYIKEIGAVSAYVGAHREIGKKYREVPLSSETEGKNYTSFYSYIHYYTDFLHFVPHLNGQKVGKM